MNPYRATNPYMGGIAAGLNCVPGASAEVFLE